MKHYILYYHAGSCNHGCEALVRTTAELLDYKNNRISLASFRPETDFEYGIDRLCEIYNMFEKAKVSRLNPEWIKGYYQLRRINDYYPLEILPTIKRINMKKGDVAISIGGDNYCYPNEIDRLINYNRVLRNHGLKTVLWGCSIEPEFLNNPIVAEDISKFDLITARETITYDAIKSINPNTLLVSDSAFHLNTIKKRLPNRFEQSNLVGINLSFLAEKYEENKGMTRNNYERLIQFILDETDMNILLIPHVIMSNSDDRQINQYLFDKFNRPDRILMVGDCSCEDLKGYIAKCRFFVGARTHATIAAYSSGIPTLVLGYSVKSRGIAKDIFGDEKHFVISSQSLTSSDELLEAFKWIANHENDIRKRLMDYIPEYKNSVYNAVKAINEL